MHVVVEGRSAEHVTLAWVKECVRMAGTTAVDARCVVVVVIQLHTWAVFLYSAVSNCSRRGATVVS